MVSEVPKLDSIFIEEVVLILIVVEYGLGAFIEEIKEQKENWS